MSYCDNASKRPHFDGNIMGQTPGNACSPTKEQPPRTNTNVLDQQRQVARKIWLWTPVVPYSSQPAINPNTISAEQRTQHHISQCKCTKHVASAVPPSVWATTFSIKFSFPPSPSLKYRAGEKLASAQGGGGYRSSTKGEHLRRRAHGWLFGNVHRKSVVLSLVFILSRRAPLRMYNGPRAILKIMKCQLYCALECAMFVGRSQCLYNCSGQTGCSHEGPFWEG